MTAPQTPVSRPRLSTSMTAMLITLPALAVIIAIVIAVSTANRPRPPAPAAGADGAAAVVDSDSHVLDEGGGGAPTLVEFLDFECEACGALYPHVEQIREQYRGRLNYVVRYFPLPGHANSMNAALAVEAAAQQDRFEEMYRKMFETQAEWGERQSSEAPRFRGFAQQLGLDLAAYDAAVADSATRARVEKDVAAGQSLGVSSTPTFFLNGEMLQLSRLSDLTDALDGAIADAS